MSLFGEFRVPVDEFALADTMPTVPDATVEIERVVASGERLAPYFWVSSPDLEAFESAARHDETVSGLEQLDEFDDAALYHADWTGKVESITYAYAELDAVLLEATGTVEGWRLRIQFDDRDSLGAFTEYCRNGDVAFSLVRLHEITSPEPGEQYGLTEKQEEALVTAYEMGFFETPRRASLEEVADELDIAVQSLSQRLRRANRNWIENALIVSEGPAAAD